MPSAARTNAFFAFLAAVAVAGVTMITLCTEARASASQASARATVVAASSDGSAANPDDLTWG